MKTPRQRRQKYLDIIDGDIVFFYHKVHAFKDDLESPEFMANYPRSLQEIGNFRQISQMGINKRIAKLLEKQMIEEINLRKLNAKPYRKIKKIEQNS